MAKELENQWAEHVSLTFHSVLRKLYTERSIGLPHFNFFDLMVLEKIFLIGQTQSRTAYVGHENCLQATRLQSRRLF